MKVGDIVYGIEKAWNKDELTPLYTTQKKAFLTTSFAFITKRLKQGGKLKVFKLTPINDEE